MITITLPIWLCWLIIIALALNVLNDVLKVYLWWLKKQLEKEKHRWWSRGGPSQ